MNRVKRSTKTRKATTARVSPSSSSFSKRSSALTHLSSRQQSSPSGFVAPISASSRRITTTTQNTTSKSVASKRSFQSTHGASEPPSFDFSSQSKRTISTTTPATEQFQRRVLPPAESQATIFGSSGQLGRMVAGYLGSTGVKLVLPYRDHGLNIRDIKLAGDVGQVAPVQFAFNDHDSVRDTMRNSNLVINCIGSFTPTMHYNEHDANVKTAFRIAQTAKEMGVDRFIHVSAAGASEHAASKFLQAKWESEEVVKQFFPNASIVRPCFIYNPDHEYLHALAKMAALDDVQNLPFPEARLQPTYARDIGAAITQIAMHPQIDGQTWTFGGDKAYSRLDLLNTFRKIINRKPHATVNPLGPVGSVVAFIKDELSYLHASHRITPTHATDYFKTSVTLDTVPRTKGFAELGIVPTENELAFIRICRPFMSITESPALQPSLYHHKIM